MPDLKEICDHIRELGNQQETPELRAEVETAFASKWEGVQAVAARVLGHWGGRRSVELLKAWLLNFYKNGRGMGIEHAATDALSECFEAEDVSWILDIYFDEPKKLYFHRIIFVLPVEIAQERIINELKHPEPKHRFLALETVISLNLVAACPAITELEHDPDASIQFLVQKYLKPLCSYYCC